MRWSAAWPHRDIKQIWANNLTVLGIIAGLVTLASVMGLLREPRKRLAATGFVIVGVVIVAVLGYEVVLADSIK